MMSLKEATSDKHKKAENMPFNTRMFRGELSKNEYLLYLTQLFQIFRTIEQSDLPHSDLIRAQRIQTDITELNSQGYESIDILKSTQAYLDHLHKMTYQQVLPHIYLNYLAIIFGGQIIKKAVPSSGMMYDFDHMQEAIQAVRSIQKDEWADEVNKGYDFIIQMFDELEQQCACG